jgi:hypothetical protein
MGMKVICRIITGSKKQEQLGGLMSTLDKRFSMVKKIRAMPTDDLAALVQPYLTWHLVTLDDKVNILLSKHTGHLSHAGLNDLVILIGAVAKQWLAKRQGYSEVGSND